MTGPGGFQPVARGFYLRRGADGADTWLAVNTDDRTMSALNAPGVAVPPEAGADSDLGAMPVADWWEAARVWPPWVYLALLAFALCSLEWWGFHRRRTE